MHAPSAHLTALGYSVTIQQQMLSLHQSQGALLDTPYPLANKVPLMSPRILQTPPFGVGARWVLSMVPICQGIARTILKLIGQARHQGPPKQLKQAQVKTMHAPTLAKSPPISCKWTAAPSVSAIRFAAIKQLLIQRLGPHSWRWCRVRLTFPKGFLRYAFMLNRRNSNGRTRLHRRV